MASHRSVVSHYSHWYAKFLAWNSKMKIARATAPLRVDGVFGAFFLMRRSAIPPPSLFDEDFFFFCEDIALAHTLLNRGVACYIVPSATIVHISGKSRSPATISSYYASKYLYLRKFHRPLHAKVISLMD